MSRWNERKDVLRGANYQARFDDLAAKGVSVHGEADFVQGLCEPGASVLDAGCGTGRVACELAERGFDVIGVDLDDAMLETARAKAPSITWELADLATVQIDRRFNVVAMPGNVMIFVTPGTEAQVVANMASHLEPQGLLVAGFQLGPQRPYDIATFDQHCSLAGLELRERWATWDEQPFADGDYAVSVHQLAG